MRPEPRGMTLGDAMALSVGVAVALGLPPYLGGGGFMPGVMPPSAMLMLFVLNMIWAAGMAVTLAILGRSARHGRDPGPGEWLALLLSAMGIVEIARNRFLFAEQSIVRSAGLDFTTARWIITAGWTLILVVGVGWIVLTRRHLPAWMTTTVGLGLAVIAIGGPVTQIQKEGPFLLGPAGGFSNTPRGLLLLQACELVASTPLGLMVAVPTMALAARWPRRRSWCWTEWAGPILFLPPLGLVSSLRPTTFAPGSGFWIADQALGVAWLVAVFALGRGIVGWWDRGARAAPGQSPMSDPGDETPASTRVT